MVSMKIDHKDPWNTFHVSVTLSQSLARPTAGQMLSEISENPGFLENRHIPACGSTGRHDGAPPVAIGSATKFATFHHLSVLGLEAMQKKSNAMTDFAFWCLACQKKTTILAQFDGKWLLILFQSGQPCVRRVTRSAKGMTALKRAIYLKKKYKCFYNVTNMYIVHTTGPQVE